MTEHLLTSSGSIHSDIIEQQTRAFTLDYLRHTILGTPRTINSEPLYGPSIIIPERQKILSPSDEKLTILPDEEEKQQYDPKQAAETSSEPLLDEGFLLKRFQKHINKATVAHYLNSEVELLRTAISIQMERVLQAVSSRDEEAFSNAFGELEGTITASFKRLLPQFYEAGVRVSDATDALQQLSETTIAAAIDKQLGAMDDQKSRKAFLGYYEDLLAAYKEQQKAAAEALEQQRQEIKIHEKAQQSETRPLHGSLSSVRWEGRNIMPKAPKYFWADNDYEPLR